MIVTRTRAGARLEINQESNGRSTIDVAHLLPAMSLEQKAQLRRLAEIASERCVARGLHKPFLVSDDELGTSWYLTAPSDEVPAVLRALERIEAGDPDPLADYVTSLDLEH